MTTEATTPAELVEQRVDRPIPPSAKAGKKAGKKAGTTSGAKAARARRAAAKRLVPAVDIEFDGRTYSITRAAADDVELFEKIEDGNYITAVRGFIGPEQWVLFKNDHRIDGRVPMARLEAFLQLIVNTMQGADEDGDSGNS